jgi:hypothetical protein
MMPKFNRIEGLETHPDYQRNGSLEAEIKITSDL